VQCTLPTKSSPRRPYLYGVCTATEDYCTKI